MTTWLKLTFALSIVALAALGAWWLTPTHATRGPEPLALGSVSEATARPVVAADAGAARASLQEPSPLSAALCPEGMVWVDGQLCVAGFESERGCRVTPAEIGVCIDRYEYPNQEGVVPAGMVTFAEAEEACAVEGKRLCRDSEWTLSCRGTRELTGCVFGSGPRPRLERVWDPAQTELEVQRVDARRPSGPSLCVSSRAVFDLPGNVEEWVRGEAANGYEAALKGGHFNKGSIGCERSVYTRQVDVRSPFVGFRCCREPLVAAPASPF